MIVFIGAICIIPIILGVIILTGKGDGLISGYNTTSEEEKLKYNIERLRIVSGLTGIITPFVCMILPFYSTIGIVLLCLIIAASLILTHTWCKL